MDTSRSIRIMSILIAIVAATAFSCSGPSDPLIVESIPSFAAPSVDAAFSPFRAGGKGLADIPFRLRLPSGLDASSILGKGDRASRGTLPASGSSFGRPLIVYLNGSDVSGSDNSRQLSPPAAVDFFLSPPLADAIVLVPQCPFDASWDSLAWPSSTRPAFRERPTGPMLTLLALVRRIEDRYGIDPKRSAIIGFSLGAFGAVEAVIRAPELFSMAAPIGGGTDAGKLSKARDVSFRIYHGERDSNVSVTMARDMAAALEGLGAACEYIEIPGAEHDVRTSAFTDPGLSSWLLNNPEE